MELIYIGNYFYHNSQTEIGTYFDKSLFDELIKNTKEGDTIPIEQARRYPDTIEQLLENGETVTVRPATLNEIEFILKCYNVKLELY